jgi:hypothetical protein
MYRQTGRQTDRQTKAQQQVVERRSELVRWFVGSVNVKG